MSRPTAQEVIAAARRFLDANDEAGLLGGRPTDPEVAEITGIPVFDAETAIRAALRSREARDDLRDLLDRWENP